MAPASAMLASNTRQGCSRRFVPVLHRLYYHLPFCRSPASPTPPGLSDRGFGFLKGASTRGIYDSMTTVVVRSLSAARMRNVSCRPLRTTLHDTHSRLCLCDAPTGRRLK